MKKLFYFLAIIALGTHPVHSKTVDTCYTESLLFEEAEKEGTVTVQGYVWTNKSSEKWAKVYGSTGFWILDVPLENTLETIGGCSILMGTYKERQVPKNCKNGSKVKATGNMTFDGLENAKVTCTAGDIKGGSQCSQFRTASHQWDDFILTSKSFSIDQKEKCERLEKAQQAAIEALKLATPNCANEDTIALWRVRSETVDGDCP